MSSKDDKESADALRFSTCCWTDIATSEEAFLSIVSDPETSSENFADIVAMAELERIALKALDKLFEFKKVPVNEYLYPLLNSKFVSVREKLFSRLIAHPDTDNSIYEWIVERSDVPEVVNRAQSILDEESALIASLS